MAIKLRRGFLVGSRNKSTAGPSTPPPVWRLKLSPLLPPPEGVAPASADYNYEFLTNSGEAAVSARKLCAGLREIERFRAPSMNRGFCKQRGDRRKKIEEEISDVEPPRDGPPDDCQPLSTGSLRRQIAATLGPNHRLVQRNGCSVQPVSPASCSRSMEVAAYKPAFTPTTTSLGSKTPSYSLKNSTELLKVLNRIWNLEEQHVSNLSLVKALKMELDQCRREIKALQREKQTRDREDIDGQMMSRDDESKLVRKKKKKKKKEEEQERLKATVESVREELEAEKKLRRQSESLHRKLTREVCEAKSCVAKALKELEEERKSRVLLENLCDEFAKSVKGYEDEIRILRSKSLAVDWENLDDRLIVHISEAWLDERLQMMKLGEDHANVVDKLGADIETFLQAKRSNGSSKEKKKLHLRWRSMESYPLNGDGHEEHCSEIDSHSLHLNNSLSRRWGKVSSLREQSANSKKLEKVDLQEGFEDHMATKETRRDNQLLHLQDLHGRRSQRVDESTHGLNSDRVLDQIERNESVSSEGDKIHPETNVMKEEDDPCGHMDLESCGTCLRLPRSVKETSLQAKLMEARLESQHSRA